MRGTKRTAVLVLSTAVYPTFSPPPHLLFLPPPPSSQILREVAPPGGYQSIWDLPQGVSQLTAQSYDRVCNGLGNMHDALREVFELSKCGVDVLLVYAILDDFLDTRSPCAQMAMLYFIGGSFVPYDFSVQLNNPTYIFSSLDAAIDDPDSGFWRSLTFRSCYDAVSTYYPGDLDQACQSGLLDTNAPEGRFHSRTGQRQLVEVSGLCPRLSTVGQGCGTPTAPDGGTGGGDGGTGGDGGGAGGDGTPDDGDVGVFFRGFSYCDPVRFCGGQLSSAFALSADCEGSWRQALQADCRAYPVGTRPDVCGCLNADLRSDEPGNARCKKLLVDGCASEPPSAGNPAPEPYMCTLCDFSKPLEQQPEGCLAAVDAFHTSRCEHDEYSQNTDPMCGLPTCFGSNFGVCTPTLIVSVSFFCMVVCVFAGVGGALTIVLSVICFAIWCRKSATLPLRYGNATPKCAQPARRCG